MTDIFEEKILHLKFTEKAEKATNLELKLAFCQSFLEKYGPKKKVDSMFENIHPSTNGIVVTDASNRYAGINIGQTARIYSASLSVSDISLRDRYSTSQAMFDIEQKARVDLAKELTIKLLHESMIDFRSERSVQQMSTIITGKIGVFRA